MKSELEKSADYPVYPAKNGADGEESSHGKDEEFYEHRRYSSPMEKSGTNWKMVFALTAAVLGFGAAAAYYLRVLQRKKQDLDLRIEDAVEFCRVKTQELDNLLHQTTAL
ncbi:MAG TPA: hypothetical protein VNK96_07545 [Fimbriimonadales bacterium]|nr:hypothetical protein [Fimbriimonadales bacterium]